MNPKLMSTFALLALGGLNGCGGGGNESGPAESLVASPDAVTVQGPDALTCATGTGPTVAIFGGTPPYKLTNSAPTAMRLSVNRLQNSGDTFVIRFLGGCLQNLPVTVEDDMGRLVTVSVSNVLGI